MLERNHFMYVHLFPNVQNHHLQLQEFLRYFIVLASYNYNYMNNSHANYSRPWYSSFLRVVETVVLETVFLSPAENMWF